MKNQESENPFVAVLELAERADVDGLGRLLASRGAWLARVEDGDGRTAAMFCAFGGHGECLRLLIEAGADLSKKDKQGWSAMDWALGGSDRACQALARGWAKTQEAKLREAKAFDAAARGQYWFLKTALDQGLDPNACKARGETLAMAAARAGQAECLGLLLGAGADIERRDAEGNGALAVAAESGSAQCLRLLVERGGDIEARCFKGWTPLMRAAARGQSASWIELLELGASSEAVDVQGRDAMGVALAHGRLEAIAAALAWEIARCAPAAKAGAKLRM